MKKVTLISFDNWNYDYHIVNEFNKQGHIANHIKLGDFKHKNLSARILNVISKIFIKKNIKHFFFKMKWVLKNYLILINTKKSILTYGIKNYFIQYLKIKNHFKILKQNRELKNLL